MNTRAGTRTRRSLLSITPYVLQLNPSLVQAHGHRFKHIVAGLARSEIRRQPGRGGFNTSSRYGAQILEFPARIHLDYYNVRLQMSDADCLVEEGNNAENFKAKNELLYVKGLEEV